MKIKKVNIVIKKVYIRIKKHFLTGLKDSKMLAHLWMLIFKKALKLKLKVAYN